MTDMARQEILPAMLAYTDTLAGAIRSKQAAEPTLTCGFEGRSLRRLSALLDEAGAAVEALEAAITALDAIPDSSAQCRFVHDELLPRMAELRRPCDAAELLMPRSVWPFPTYGDLLFGV